MFAKLPLMKRFVDGVMGSYPNSSTSSSKIIQDPARMSFTFQCHFLLERGQNVNPLNWFHLAVLVILKTLFECG